MDEAKFRVNGKEYSIPQDVTLGEMCDAEQYFGVDFNEPQKSGVRMIAALLWIAIKRADPTVTIDDIRALPPETFASIEGDDAGPPDGQTDSSEPSVSSSSNDSGDSVSDLSSIGDPGSDISVRSGPVTSAT